MDDRFQYLLDAWNRKLAEMQKTKLKYPTDEESAMQFGFESMLEDCIAELQMVIDNITTDEESAIIRRWGE